jgi:hypothetical protein
MCGTIFTGVWNGCAPVLWLKGYGIIAMQRTERSDDHERFRELCALAQANSIGIGERLDLERHLKICGACRIIYGQYSAISERGMGFLSGGDALAEEAMRWDNREAREKLFSSIRGQRPQKVVSIMASSPRRSWGFVPSITNEELAFAALAACAVIAVALGAYHIGEQKSVVSPAQSAVVRMSQYPTAPEKRASVDQSAAQAAQISNLERQISSKEQEIAQLRAASIIAEERINELGSANDTKETDLQLLAEERDQLTGKLAENEKVYEALQADYSSLRAEQTRNLLHAASLESELTSLTAANQEQERRIKDDEQYLTSDRDIRELIGARKLYIADVFDVDSGSRTRKPFGRVFYTENKSLVFYAFDLDHQSGVKNASVFQVWGQRDSDPNGAPHPMNLGILYMDNETNRRWVLRSDDPKQLAEIDAVFVTVEPHGGSQKPTGKPLLYALLRKEANHP